MRPPCPDDLEVLAKARAIIKLLYNVYREDSHLARDYQLWAALQKPALALVGTLANAAGSGQVTYYSKGVSFARSHCAELRTLLDAAQDVGGIETSNHRALQAIVVEVQTMLNQLGAALEKRLVGC